MLALLFYLVLHTGNTFAQHASITFAVNLKELCEQCDTSTGSGYVNHPTYCHLFIHCSLGSDNSVVGQVKECTRGLLWSQQVKQCVWPNESDCPTNPCLDKSKTIRDLRTCNGFFTCPEGDRLQYNCCLKDERFVEGEGVCVPDKGCNDPCLPGSANNTAEAPECKRFPDPTDRHKYIWLTGGKNITMNCAQGTAFSETFCSCTDTADVEENKKCEPYIYFPFDNNIKDVKGKTATGGSDSWIRKSEPASVGGGAAYFNGRRQVIAWALNNMEFRSNFTLHFRFKADLGQNGDSERFALIDNSDCEKEATFGVALLRTSRRTGSIHGGFRLKNGEAVTTSSSDILLTTWHDVALIKHGSRVELRVDGQVYPIMGTGLLSDIDRVDCSMTIGKGTGLMNFIGYIDEAKFYKCVPAEFMSN